MKKNIIIGIAALAVIGIGAYFLMNREPVIEGETSTAVLYNIEGSEGLGFDVRVNDIPVAESVSLAGDLRLVLRPGKNVVTVALSGNMKENDAPFFSLDIRERIVKKNEAQTIEPKKGDKVLVAYKWDLKTAPLPATFTQEFDSKQGVAGLISDKGDVVTINPESKKGVLAAALAIHTAFAKKDAETLKVSLLPIFEETFAVFGKTKADAEVALSQIEGSIKRGDIVFEKVSSRVDDFAYVLYNNGKAIRIRTKDGQSFLHTSADVNGFGQGFDLSFSKINGKWVWVR